MQAVWIILIVIVYIALTIMVGAVVASERKDISIFNVVLICLFFTPVLGLIVGMMSPRKSVEVETIEKHHDPQDNAKIFQSKDPNDKSRYSDGLW
jgi:hypothetical protein